MARDQVSDALVQKKASFIEQAAPLGAPLSTMIDAVPSTAEHDGFQLVLSGTMLAPHRLHLGSVSALHRLCAGTISALHRLILVCVGSASSRYLLP